ncbi:MAG: hypothetical protein HZC29_01085 [Thaumarchaeota archaeon]|nr:hypothetical protein [Nitrososphaerota archaeon]
MTSILDWLINPTKSKVFLFSHSIGGTTRYRLLKGCVPSRVRINIPNRGLIRIDATIVVFQPQAEADTTGLTGTPVLDTTGLSGTPWKHSSGGLNSFTFNSVTYKERGIDIEISHEYTILDSSDSDVVLWATPTIKKVTGNVNIFKKDILISADAFALTDRSASRVLKSATKTLTFTDMNFHNHTTSIKRGSSDATIEALPFIADDIA